MRRVAVVGHGYVGKGIAKMFAGGFEVVIHDAQAYPDRTRVSGADLAVVCVPTPTATDGQADVSAVEEVVSWVDAPLVCLKSTVPPGTTDWLAAETGKAVHFSPEYMGEPYNYVAPWRAPDPCRPERHDFVIVGGSRASEVLDYFLAVMAVDARYWAVSALEAELTKYMENAYFATKVVFCGEFARLAQAYGVDYKRLRELWLLDPRVEPDHTAVFSGRPGFGGKCLPKDLQALVAAAERSGYSAEFLRAVLEANERFREGGDT